MVGGRRAGGRAGGVAAAGRAAAHASSSGSSVRTPHCGGTHASSTARATRVNVSIFAAAASRLSSTPRGISAGGSDAHDP